MKLLRESIRNILLTEAAATMADGPENLVIVIEDLDTWARIYYAVIADAATGELSDALSFRDGVVAQNGDTIQGIIEIEDNDERGPCGGAWKVSWANASSGWGPLLYDVALEWASTKASGLIPDRSSVTADANYVWDYYMTKRNDVEHFQLDDLYNRLTPEENDNCNQDVAAEDPNAYDWQESSLSKMYVKNSSTTIDRLKQAGKLVVI